MLKDKNKIKKWLDKYKIKNYTINDDLTVDVAGNALLFHKELKQIPVQFNHVTGNFSCCNNQLTSLEGCPQSVGGHFSCYTNQLTSLEFCPHTVGGVFNCKNNQLSSLKFCPQSVGGNFWCSHNQLTSLEFCPQFVKERFYCDKNSQLGETQEINKFAYIYAQHKAKLAEILQDSLEKQLPCKIENKPKVKL